VGPLGGVSRANGLVASLWAGVDGSRGGMHLAMETSVGSRGPEKASGEAIADHLEDRPSTQAGARMHGGALEIQARNWAATATAVR